MIWLLPPAGRSDAMIRGVAVVLLAVLVSGCRSTAEPSVAADHARWPHEPAGLSALTDRRWSELTGDGWQRRDGPNDRIVTDANAPLPPASALEYVYPAGFDGGTAPATHYYPLGHRKELFVGLEWKVSDPWQGHASLVNKIQFLFTGGSDVFMTMYGPKGGPYELRVMPQWREHGDAWLVPNAPASSVTLGQWHRIEWYLKYESTYGVGDGVVRWWLDGVLVGDYSNVRYPADAGFTEYQISPTWGGVGDIKAETDYYRFDRSYISAAPPSVSRRLDPRAILQAEERSYGEAGLPNQVPGHGRQREPRAKRWTLDRETSQEIPDL
jgi:hypothetical protein